MCQECQEIEVGYSESSEAWDRTVGYRSEETLLNSGIKEEVSGKVCQTCKEWKVFSEFGLNKSRKDGHEPKCLACKNAYQRKRRSPDFVSSVVEEEFDPRTKVCSQCGVLKFITEFSRNKNAKDGRRAQCKSCDYKYNKEFVASGFLLSHKRRENSGGLYQCTACWELKPVTCFSKNKSCTGGVLTTCKDCVNLIRKKWKDKKVEDLGGKILIEFKKCPGCKETKAASFFYPWVWSKDGLDSYCKDCVSARASKRNSTLNFVADMSISKVCHTCGLEKGADRFYKCHRSTDGLESNCKACESVRKAEYFKTNLEARIRRAIRGRLHYFKNHAGDSDSAIEFLGCTMSELLARLEGMFYKNPETGEEMTWDNYGKMGWHIDHIVPLAIFRLEDEVQFSYACRFDNLQPMWRKENLRKSSKFPSEMVA